MSSLYILDIKAFSDVSLSTMFSHSGGYLLILLMASFAAQKLLNLMQTHLFIFSFVSFIQGDISEKYIAGRKVLDFIADLFF